VFNDRGLHPGPQKTPKLDLRGRLVAGKDTEDRTGKGQNGGRQRRDHPPYHKFLAGSTAHPQTSQAGFKGVASRQGGTEKGRQGRDKRVKGEEVSPCGQFPGSASVKHSRACPNCHRSGITTRSHCFTLFARRRS